MRSSYHFTSDQPEKNVIYLILFVAIVVVYAITYGSIIYVIYQASLNQNLSFSEAWAKGKSKLFRIVGFLFLWFVISLLAGVFPMLIKSSITSNVVAVPLLVINTLIANVFYSPFIVIGIAAIVIGGLNAWSAARTGFLVIVNNLFRILIVIASIFLIRFLVYWLLSKFIAPGIANTEAVIQSFLNNANEYNLLEIPAFGIASLIISLIVFPWMCVYFTLVYLKFTEKTAYQSLIQKKRPNTGSGQQHSL
jgi:hypothetical protein